MADDDVPVEDPFFFRRPGSTRSPTPLPRERPDPPPPAPGTPVIDPNARMTGPAVTGPIPGVTPATPTNSIADWFRSGGGLVEHRPLHNFLEWWRGQTEEAGPPDPATAQGMVRQPGGYGPIDPNTGLQTFQPGRNVPLFGPSTNPVTGATMPGTTYTLPNGDTWQFFGNAPTSGASWWQRHGPGWLGGGVPLTGWAKYNRATGEWEAGTPPPQPPEVGPTGKRLVLDPNDPRGRGRAGFPGDTGERPDIPGRPDLNRLSPEERRRYPPATGEERDPRTMGGGPGGRGGPFGRGGGMGGMMGGPMGMGNPFAAFLSRMGGGGIPYGLFGAAGPYAGTSNILPGYEAGGGGGYTGYGEGQYDPVGGAAGGGGGYDVPPGGAGAAPVAPGGPAGGVPAAAANPATTAPAATPPGGAGTAPAAGAPGGGATPSVPAAAPTGGTTAPRPSRAPWPVGPGPFGLPGVYGAADGGTTNVAAAGPTAADFAAASAAPLGPDVSRGTRGATAAAGRNQTLGTVGSTLSAAGLPPSAVNAIWANIISESSGNPTLRHPDQPKWGGEAHYAHGLYQEGGEEWNRYARWLGGRDWRDPALQTQFLASNIQTRYPRLWSKLMDPNRSQEQKAVDFMAEYLRPARQHQNTRSAQYRRGIPNAWTPVPVTTTA